MTEPLLVRRETHIAFRQGPAFASPRRPERARPSCVRLWEPGAYDSARSRHCNKEDT